MKKEWRCHLCEDITRSSEFMLTHLMGKHGLKLINLHMDYASIAGVVNDRQKGTKIVSTVASYFETEEPEDKKTC
jgi:hypothetical protein